MTRSLEITEEGSLQIPYRNQGSAGIYTVPYTIRRIEGNLQLMISGVFQGGKRVPLPYSKDICEQIRLEADCASRGIETIVYLP